MLGIYYDGPKLIIKPKIKLERPHEFPKSLVSL